MAITHPSVRRPVDVAGAARTAAHVLAAAAVYVVFGSLWYFAAKEKLVDQSGTMPAGLAKGFDGTFLATVPGLDAAWVLLGVMEAVAFVLFVASAVRGEFLPARQRPVLLVALGFSALTFAVMAFANDMAGSFDTAYELFVYLAGTVVIIGAVVASTARR